MKKAILTVLIMVCFVGLSFAGTTFEAATPDGKETDIGKVKVREFESVSDSDLAIINKYNPRFQPANKMHRLELVDDEIEKLQAEVDVLTGQIVDLVLLRDKVEAAAKTVALKTK